MPWMVRQTHNHNAGGTLACRDRGTMACPGWLTKGTTGLTDAQWYVETEAQWPVMDG